MYHLIGGLAVMAFIAAIVGFIFWKATRPTGGFPGYPPSHGDPGVGGADDGHVGDGGGH